jgi:hypothetical protein
MNGNVKKISWFGIVLIVLGLFMLLDRFDLIQFHFSNVFWPLMMLLGIMAVARGFNQNRRGKIFWGTTLFLYSLFFLLKSIDYFEIYGQTIFPATFLIFGIAFFMLYINNLKDWPFLIPTVLLTGIGGAFLLSEYGYLYRWDVIDVVRTYWPVILILTGLGLLFRRYNSKPNEVTVKDGPVNPS